MQIRKDCDCNRRCSHLHSQGVRRGAKEGLELAGLVQSLEKEFGGPAAIAADRNGSRTQGAPIYQTKQGAAVTRIYILAKTERQSAICLAPDVIQRYHPAAHDGAILQCGVVRDELVPGVGFLLGDERYPDVGPVAEQKVAIVTLVLDHYRFSTSRALSDSDVERPAVVNDCETQKIAFMIEYQVQLECALGPPELYSSAGRLSYIDRRLIQNHGVVLEPKLVPDYETRRKA